MDQSYFTKLAQPNSDAPLWNLPERPQGNLTIIGGNTQNFRAIIRVSEFLAQNFRIQTTKTVLPETLKAHLPPLDNFVFLPATSSGSFAASPELSSVLNSTDFNLIAGDLSKNTITKSAFLSALQSCETPSLITRDAIDLLSDPAIENLLSTKQLVLFATSTQLQKLLHTILYPKIITLSMSLLQFADILHKFTLSYPAAIITLQNNQIIIAKNGHVTAIPLEKTSYTPITIWSGELAAKITAFNLFNPNNFIDATISACFFAT